MRSMPSLNLLRKEGNGMTIENQQLMHFGILFRFHAISIPSLAQD